jgi:hypothetical protein
MAFLGSASVGGVALGFAADELSAAWALAAAAAVMLLAAVLVAGAARQRDVAVQR